MHGPNFWGNLIRELREERGISQRELARHSGINRNTLRSLESGTCTSVIHVERLLAFFGYEIDAFASPDREAS